MGYRIGSGYIGSSELQTSIANQEIIPTRENGRPYNCYKFAFMNDQACTILINKSITPILLRSGQGFSISEIDSPIHSFKIVESGITFNFIGCV